MSDDVRKPFIKFETVAIEDRQMTQQTGMYMTKDVDFIIIIPYGSEGKTELREIYKDWLDKIKRQMGPVRAAGADNGTPMIVESRFPREWLEMIEKGYELWKKGEELPVEGTPLKQWAALSPAMLQNFIAHHVYTIEQLAAASDEAINPVGMGARIFRNQAQDWVKLNKEGENGKVLEELKQMRADNVRLQQQVGELMAQNQEMNARIPNTDPTKIMQQHVGARSKAAA